MFNKIKTIFSYPLFTESAVMIVGSNLANFFAYIYHLVIGRLLGPSAYGELASIINLTGLFAVTFGFLGLVIVKFVSASKKEDLPAFFSWVNKRTLIAAASVSSLALFATPFIAKFLNSSYLSVIFVGPILFVYFVGYIYRSFLQGLLEFGKVVVVSNLDLLFRLAIGVTLVYLGFSVFGAVVGIFVASSFSLIITAYFLKKYAKRGSKKNVFGQGKEVWAYSIPILIMSISTNSMYLSDVILVKHFLDPHLSGIYASLSTLGKIVFYGTAPISSVMFPLVSQSYVKSGNYKKIFFLSLALTASVAAGLVGIYFFFPKIVISLLYGEKFLEGARFLVWFGIFMTIFTLASLFLNYFLSIGVTKVVYAALIAAVFQVAGIWTFHSSILAVVKVSTFVSSVLFLFLVIYFGYESIGHNSLLQSGKGDR